jgi:hypothetical protein
MSVFLFPKGLCSEINSLMQKFWWGHKEKEKKIAWMSWSKMGNSKGKGGMGFRDFTCFNKALLAKQIWRIWKFPDSLTARIMKGKYFPNCTVLEANLGRKPSFAWRSIHSSSGLIREGLVWRVGNGEKIRIWEDKWLPTPTTYKIQSPPAVLDPSAKVCELIERNTRWWNISLLEQIFSPDEVKKILSIPLSSTNKDDILLWRGTVKGEFSVRSAYHLQRELEEVNMAGCSTSSSDVWDKIWRMKVPNVEKHFLWKASHEILPTRANLFRRKIIDDPLCPICGLEEETVFHILWQCSSAMDVWSEGVRKFQKSAHGGPNFLQVVEDMFSTCDEEEMRLFVGLARRIWLRRNESVHGGVFSSPKEILLKTQGAILEFQAAHEKKVTPGNNEKLIQWVTPPIGWVLVNWDAAIKKEKGWVGIGVLIRDHNGKMILAKSTTWKGYLGPAEAEAWQQFQQLRYVGHGVLIGHCLWEMQKWSLMLLIMERPGRV